MVAMQMGDKYMVDPPHFKSELPQLNLRTLAAIDQKKLFVEPHNL